MKTIKLYEIDHDYLRLIRKFNKEGRLFIPRMMGKGGYNSLERLVKARQIEYINRGIVGGYQLVGTTDTLYLS